LALVMRWLIVVARDEPDLYEIMRKDHFGEESITVILDRRRTERRRRSDPDVPNRRHTERRHRDIDRALINEGWAQIRLPED
jgi:hypothetical protein